MSSADIILNLTGNAEKKLEQLTKKADKLSKSTSKAVSGKAGSEGINDPAKIKELQEQKKRDNLLKRQESLQTREEKQFRLEQRNSRMEFRNRLGMLSGLSNLSIFSPFRALQSMGGAVGRRSMLYQEKRDQYASMYMEAGLERRDAIRQANRQRDGGLVPLGLASRLTGPVGYGLAIGGGVGASLLNISGRRREKVSPFLNTAMRDNISDKGLADLIKFIEGNELMHDPDAVASMLNNIIRTPGESISKSISNVMKMSGLGRAYGVDPNTISAVQNLSTMRAEGTSGFKGVPTRIQDQRLMFGYGERRNANNMDLFLKNLSSLLADTFGSTGAFKEGLADILSRFGGAYMQVASANIHRASSSMRDWVGHDSRKEQFMIRAFGSYEGAVEAMEGGLTTDTFQKILKQARAEGWGGGMGIFLKDFLNLFSTRRGAREFVKKFEADDIKGMELAVDTVEDKYKNYKEMELAGAGKWSKKGQSLLTGVILNQNDNLSYLDYQPLLPKKVKIKTEPMTLTDLLESDLKKANKLKKLGNFITKEQINENRISYLDSSSSYRKEISEKLGEEKLKKYEEDWGGLEETKEIDTPDESIGLLTSILEELKKTNSKPENIEIKASTFSNDE